MQPCRNRHYRAHAAENVAALCLILALASPVHAADASAWDAGVHSAVRLVAGANPAGSASVRRAGIEFKLQPGWKTYWRYPGDSGIPPQFIFARSDNVARVEVLWPAPRRMAEADGVVIGYKDALLLPLRVVPQDPARPVLLRVDVDYAVCEQLCVPVSAAAELRLDDGSGAQEPTLAAAEARVPRRQPLGADAALSVRAVHKVHNGERPRVIVDLAAPDGAAVELFAEGPTPAWTLPVPEPVNEAPAGLRRFAFDLDGLPPGTKPDGVPLTLTAVAGDQAIEVQVRIE